MLNDNEISMISRVFAAAFAIREAHKGFGRSAQDTLRSNSFISGNFDEYRSILSELLGLSSYYRDSIDTSIRSLVTHAARLRKDSMLYTKSADSIYGEASRICDSIARCRDIFVSINAYVRNVNINTYIGIVTKDVRELNRHGRIGIDIEEGTITFTTTPITLVSERTKTSRDFGRFMIRLYADMLAAGFGVKHCFEVIPVDSCVYPSRERRSGQLEHSHPHVHNRIMCTGELTEVLFSCLKEIDIVSFFMSIESTLGEYNPESPYVSLEAWDGHTCRECGDVFDQLYSCYVCGQQFCERHSVYNENTERDYCLTHAVRCAICNEAFSIDELSTGVCDNCMDSNTSSDIRRAQAVFLQNHGMYQMAQSSTSTTSESRVFGAQASAIPAVNIIEAESDDEADDEADDDEAEVEVEHVDLNRQPVVINSLDGLIVTDSNSLFTNITTMDNLTELAQRVMEGYDEQ